MLTGKELPEVGHPQSEESKELLEWGRQCVARGVDNGKPIFADIARGAVIQDLDGNRYIDFFGGIGVLNAGHCPEPVVEAIRQQSERYMHTFHTIIRHEHYVKLSKKLCEIAPGPSAKKAMLVNSGAEADENAIKIARRYNGKAGILSYDNAFHGRTLLTLSITAKVKPYKFGFGPFAPEVHKLTTPYCYRCPWGASYPGCAMHCLEYFKSFFKGGIDPDQVSCLIIEPVMGEGGFIMPPKEYFQGLREILSEKGIVFIMDEIQTGFCRTGKMFASEWFGIEPDLLTCAKSIASGLPVSGVVGKAEIMDAPDPGAIGGTFAGNPVACAAGVATIAYYQQNQLWERAMAINAYVLPRLEELQEKYPERIGDIRALGAMIAMEFVKSKQGKEPDKEAVGRICGEALKNGLILIDCGIEGNVIRMLMPLVITDEQLAYAIDILEKACATVLG